MLTTDINKLREELHRLTQRYNNIMAALELDPSLKPQYAQELEAIDKQMERITFLIGMVV